MALSYVGNSTMPTGTGSGTGTTSLTLATALTAGGSADDLYVMFVHCKPATATITTPAGWLDVSNGEAAGGGGTTGADTGPTRLKAMYRYGPWLGTQAVSLASSPNCCEGIICCISSSVIDASFDVAGANGIDTTTGTPFTAAMNVDPNITTDDMVLVFGGTPTDITTPAQFSAETLTATGLTSGSVTEIGEPETTQGNDLGSVLCRWTPTGGPSSSVATFSATAAATNTNTRGPIVLVRVREVAAANQVPRIAHRQLRAA